MKSTGEEVFMAEIVLDIATYEGKTWLAVVTGVGGKYGIERTFVNAVRKDTSRSGATGSAVYVVDDGLYESNEGRKRLGRRYWRVQGDQVTEVALDEVRAAFGK
jgi:hypothetical protein